MHASFLRNRKTFFENNFNIQDSNERATVNDPWKYEEFILLNVMTNFLHEFLLNFMYQHLVVVTSVDKR